MIELRDLRVDYDDVCAVQDLTLKIEPGEIFGLIGPNGAGKSTTMRTMMGLIEATYGDVLLNGVDVTVHREEAVASVGYMPDFSPLYEDLTVYEFLDLFAASYGIPIRQRKDVVEQHLSQVNLTEKRDAMTAGLSRGMKQRLMLAKTLIPDPTILLLDEPASGMDPMGRALLKQLMRDLAKKGKCVIISSHILSEMSEFCTSVGIMEKGRMVMHGHVDDVVQRVLGQSELEIKIVSGHDALEALLKTTTRAGEPKHEGNIYHFSFDGDDADASDFLEKAITQGVRISAFGRRKEGLEEVFLKVGAQEVS